MSDNVEAVKKIMQEQIDGLTAELALRTAEAKNQAVTIKDAVERIEMLNSALAARDVIIGVKVSALKRYGWHGGGEKICEHSKHSDYPCTCGLKEALETPDTNEVAEAVTGLIDSVRKYTSVRCCAHFEPKPHNKTNCMHPVIEALARIDKALKGIK